MNVEAIVTFRRVRVPWRGLWLPPVLALCGLASAGGAIAYGVTVTAALTVAPATSVTVTRTALSYLSKIVTSLSFWEFIEAFTIGTIAVTCQ